MFWRTYFKRFSFEMAEMVSFTVETEEIGFQSISAMPI